MDGGSTTQNNPFRIRRIVHSVLECQQIGHIPWMENVFTNICTQPVVKRLTNYTKKIVPKLNRKKVTGGKMSRFQTILYKESVVLRLQTHDWFYHTPDHLPRLHIVSALDLHLGNDLIGLLFTVAPTLHEGVDDSLADSRRHVSSRPTEVEVSILLAEVIVDDFRVLTCAM